MSVARNYSYRSTQRANERYSPESKLSSGESSPAFEENNISRRRSASDDSDAEEIEEKMRNGEFSNLAADNINLIKDSTEIPEENIRTVNTRRNINRNTNAIQSSLNSNSSVSSSLEKGFVPKTIVNNKQKRDRNYQRYKSDSKSNDESDEDTNTNQWIKGPKKFLDGESNTINNDKENNNQSSNWNSAKPIRQDDKLSDSYKSNRSNREQSSLASRISSFQNVNPNQLVNCDDEDESSYTETREENLITPTEDEINNDEDDDLSYTYSTVKTTVESKPPRTSSISSSRDGIAYTDNINRPESLSSNNSMRKSGRYDEEDRSKTPMKTMGDVYGTASPAFVRNYESNKMLSTKVPKESFVLIAPLKGERTNLVHCTVRRDRNSLQGKLYPTYEMVLETTNKVIIIARKMELNRTSNYHLFDMTRGQAGSKLSKKNGNYLGKLRAKNIQRTDYVLLNQSSEKEEVAGVTFERLSLLEQLKEGNQPRKMKLVLPKLDEDNVPMPNKVEDNGSGSLLDILVSSNNNNRGTTSRIHVLETKDPVFENGNYRLNFNGRVTKPSVKNFQMVANDDIDDVLCQFGKVDEDEFHLDYKTPLNAFQAFALALCQFNL